MKSYWGTAMPSRLYIVCGGFWTPMEELGCCDGDHSGLQRLKYFLSGHLPKNFADPCPRPLRCKTAHLMLSHPRVKVTAAIRQSGASQWSHTCRHCTAVIPMASKLATAVAGVSSLPLESVCDKIIQMLAHISTVDMIADVAQNPQKAIMQPMGGLSHSHKS